MNVEAVPEEEARLDIEHATAEPDVGRVAISPDSHAGVPGSSGFCHK
jgi:hypothetical protein